MVLCHAVNTNHLGVVLLPHLAMPLMQPLAMTLLDPMGKKVSSPLHATAHLPVVLHMHQLPRLQACGKPETSFLLISVLHLALLAQD